MRNIEETIQLKNLGKNIDDPVQGKKYDLLGFANYKSGHYTTIYFRTDLNSWWKIDDLRGTAEQISENFEATPSLLIFLRK